MLQRSVVWGIFNSLFLFCFIGLSHCNVNRNVYICIYLKDYGGNYYGRNLLSIDRFFLCIYNVRGKV